MTLTDLVYVSYATQPMSTEDLVALLEECRRKNQAKQITGMLLYRDRFFIQVLEGEAADLEALYQRIQHDPRHQNILLIEKTPITARSFSDWSMGFKNLDSADAVKYPGFTAFLTQPVPPSYFEQNPSHAKALLVTFKEEIYY